MGVGGLGRWGGGGAREMGWRGAREMGVGGWGGVHCIQFTINTVLS